jgi:hypothetical protein
MKVALKDRVTEATLSYTVRFSEDYDWTTGGKLPGLSSVGVHIRFLSPVSPARVHVTEWRLACPGVPVTQPSRLLRPECDVISLSEMKHHSQH